MKASEYKKIAGILPKKNEVGSWGEPKIIAALEFSRHFMKDGESRGKKTLVYDVSDETIKAAWDSDREHWKEFMHRIEVVAKGEKPRAARLNAFRTRLMNFIRTVCAYLKSNPHAITPEIEGLMRGNDRFSWALDTFHVERSELGELVVMPNDLETTDPSLYNANPNQTKTILPQARYQNAVAKAASILEALLDGIDIKQLAKMDMAKRLKMADDLIRTLGKAYGGNAPARSVFNTIVVNKSSREDLEKSLLGYVEAQNE